MTMTRQEFEAYWAVNSGLTVSAVRELGFHAESCDCGDSTCLGWVMTHYQESARRIT